MFKWVKLKLKIKELQGMIEAFIKEITDKDILIEKQRREILELKEQLHKIKCK